MRMDEARSGTSIAESILADVTPIDWPGEGSVVTDPIPILGTWRERESPEIVIDRHLRISFGRCGIRDRHRFAALLGVPFLSEGPHRISLRLTGEDEDIGLRTVYVRRPGRAGPPDSIHATSTAIVGRRLNRFAGGARVEVDGAPWTASEWICGRIDGAWAGFAWLDLERLPAGLHRIAVEPEEEPAASYKLERIPSTPRRGEGSPPWPLAGATASCGRNGRGA